jgi:hypothetical protein
VQFDSELDRIRAVMDRQHEPSLRAEAFRSLESLADSGDVEAQYLYATIYLFYILHSSRQMTITVYSYVRTIL